MYKFRAPLIAHRWRGLVAILALSMVAAAAQPTVDRADPQRYLADVTTLAAPNMEGRGPGTKGLERAAHLIQKRFHSLGLETAGTNGYFQPFSVVTGAKLKRGNHFRVVDNGAKHELTIKDDYVPFSFSTSGSAVATPLVFAGYGASATEFGYDDYAGIDVKDKIVVVLLHEPAGFVAKVGSSGLTRHAQLLTKAINARNHGAKAIVIINGKLGDGEEDTLTRFGSVNGPTDVGIVMVQAKNAVAESWFHTAKKSLNETQVQIDHATQPASFPFPETLRVSLNVNIETTHAKIENVLAYLPGKTDEYVIVGAHYDHLGRGNFDSLAPSQIGQIHPGADDNASGTAGVLELARLLAPLKGRLARGILFMSFSGEELGLLGSAEWVKHPTRPLDKATAMINMDMIGRIKNEKIYVGGVGTGSTFKNILEATPGKDNFKIEYSAGGYAASDHTSFVTQKIPVLFFFSGLHSDYHKPSDTSDKINAPDAARLLDFISGVILRIADAPERPAYVAVVEDKPSGTSGGGGGYGPYFGSIPDFGQTENGVRFSDVKPGSPAAKAGLKAGDVLIQFGDKPIKNLYDFTDALRASKVGDVVEVTVLRDGHPLKASVKLEPRR
jgi:peptidase M28-like protein/PDZ domain-containing protein/PA domain-containing protein